MYGVQYCKWNNSNWVFRGNMHQTSRKPSYIPNIHNGLVRVQMCAVVVFIPNFYSRTAHTVGNIPNIYARYTIKKLLFISFRFFHAIFFNLWTYFYPRSYCSLQFRYWNEIRSFRITRIIRWSFMPTRVEVPAEIKPLIHIRGDINLKNISSRSTAFEKGTGVASVICRLQIYD